MTDELIRSKVKLLKIVIDSWGTIDTQGLIT